MADGLGGKFGNVPVAAGFNPLQIGCGKFCSGGLKLPVQSVRRLKTRQQDYFRIK
jgi:hypothetical protein